MSATLGSLPEAVHAVLQQLRLLHEPSSNAEEVQRGIQRIPSGAQRSLFAYLSAAGRELTAAQSMQGQKGYNRMYITSFLILPIQRIPRYEMFLKVGDGAWRTQAL